jgi:hypothetical protein
MTTRVASTRNSSSDPSTGSARSTADTASTVSSTPTILGAVDWKSLSPSALETATGLIGTLLAASYSFPEIGREVGLSPERVSRRVAELRAELEAQPEPPE